MISFFAHLARHTMEFLNSNVPEFIEPHNWPLRGHPFMMSTRREGRGVRLRWMHVDGEGGPAPCGRPHRKLKLESTDVILSSSHAKKLASFLPEFRLWTEKKWKFFCDIN